MLFSQYVQPYLELLNVIYSTMNFSHLLRFQLTLRLRATEYAPQKAKLPQYLPDTIAY
jgi:hypothetical protein